MQKFFSLFFALLPCFLFAQWTTTADDIDPNHYYGITVANGMVGLVSSPEPMRIQDVVLNGVYDNYQRGRVSNILKTFNHLNMNLDVDGARIGPKNISNFRQELNMRTAELVTTFDVGDKLSVTGVSPEEKTFVVK
nr:hypothetical protein [Neolewinella agarilytica]